MKEYLIIYIDMDIKVDNYKNLMKFINSNYKDFVILKEKYNELKNDVNKYNSSEYIPFDFKKGYSSSFWLSNKNLILELFIDYFVNYNPHNIKDIKSVKKIIKDITNNSNLKNKRIKIFEPNYNEMYPHGNIFDVEKISFFDTLWHINIINKKDLENIYEEKLDKNYLRNITKNKNIHLKKLSDETYLLSAIDEKGNIDFLEDKDIFTLRKALLKEEKLPHDLGLRLYDEK